MSPRPRTFTNEELITAMETHELPFSTATELSEQLDVTSGAVLDRLHELEKVGRVESKDVGSRAKVWWLPD